MSCVSAGQGQVMRWCVTELNNLSSKSDYGNEKVISNPLLLTLNSLLPSIYVHVEYNLLRIIQQYAINLNGLVIWYYFNIYLLPRQVHYNYRSHHIPAVDCLNTHSSVCISS